MTLFLQSQGFFSRYKKEAEEEAETDAAMGVAAEDVPVSFSDLFRYADRTDHILLVVGYTLTPLLSPSKKFFAQLRIHIYFVCFFGLSGYIVALPAHWPGLLFP